MLLLVAGVTSAAAPHTEKIAVKGASLAEPIEIAAGRAKEYRVWAGPGVTVNGVEETEGFIIDWQRGSVAERPAGWARYEVSFFAPFRSRTSHVVYAVTYTLDPATGKGFVFLPGDGDSRYPMNSATMLHGRGLEGNWFHAIGSWDKLIQPLIAASRRQ